MESPDNLVDAVSRLNPRGILLLDTNTIMDAPRLDLYEINTEGKFLMVVPVLVVSELMKLKRGGKDKETQEKAYRACSLTDRIYKRGNAATGIELNNGHFLITVDSAKPSNGSKLEDERFRMILGKVDTSLLKLADDCSRAFPETSTLLITRDWDLSHTARSRGIPVCRLSELRSRERLEKVLRQSGTSAEPATDIFEHIRAQIGTDVERPVKIAMKLEALSSEGQDFVARGSGHLRYDATRFPFRWTFPYRNLAAYKNLWTEVIDEDAEYAVMPLENVDFMGAEEKIPDAVKRLVCRMLEGAYEEKHLQTPRTALRFEFHWATVMYWFKSEPFGPRAEVHKRKLSLEEAERYDELSTAYDRHIYSLVDGSAESVGNVYRSALHLSEKLEELLGWDEKYDPESGPLDLESALIWLLDVVFDTWSVGETREEDYTYSPFVWPEQEVALDESYDDPGES